jgi:hypothetical protein
MSNQPTTAEHESSQETKETVRGTKTLLLGPPGSGKTFAISTACAVPGLEVFYLDLEGSRESLMGAFTDFGKPIPANLHYHDQEPANASWSDMIDMATKVNTYSLKMLSDMTDAKRSSHNEFIKLLQTLHNFTDDRTKQAFGDVSAWGTNRLLAVDGLTGLNNAAMSLTIGGKPVASQSDWQIAQNTLLNMVRKLTKDCACHVILIGHLEREVDEVLGGIKLMASTLGKKLAPKLPSMFSDVVMAVKTGAQFTWDTSNNLADLKTRNLPIATGLKPDFGQIIAKWQSRGGKLE